MKGSHTKNNRMKAQKLILSILIICILPIYVFAQHEVVQHEFSENSLIYEVLEWVEFVVDMFGIGILLLGFVKGIWYFLKLEIDRLNSRRDFEEVFALRSTLGSYIILSLDFLIISDIIHSVMKPELMELVNLAIIVVLRTSIGFFLGRELMELTHSMKNKDKDAEKIESVEE